MEWSEVLDPTLSPREVLCERIPAMHASRLDQFQRLVKTSLIFSFVFTDVDERYTLVLSDDEARGQQGDMIDFPQATARGTIDSWQRSIDLLSKLVEPADEQIERVEGRLAVSESIKQGFEKFDGVLEIKIEDPPDTDKPLTFEVVLNDYSEPSWASRVTLGVDWSVLVELANGRIGPVEAARQVRLGGSVGLAVDLGGYFMNEFDL